MTNKKNILGKLSLTLIIFGFLFAGSGSLLAQGGTGVRMGVSIDPDQIYFGGHFEAGPIMEPGFNILMALAHRDGLFTELKLGALDSPDLKFGIGFSWR